MSALSLNDDAVQVRLARMQAMGDRLRARLRLESSLGGVAAADLGLSSRALLFVKCCTLRLGADDGRAPGVAACRLRSNLATQLARARQPWHEAACGEAEAVLFDDEAQLIACLIRDELRGTWRQHWWWSGVLAGATPREWLRRHALGRGERLAPALLMLAAGGRASPWLAGLDEQEAALALRSIVRAYALPPATAAPQAERSEGLPRSEPGAQETRTAIEQRAESALTEQLKRTLHSLAADSLGPTQRRVMLAAWVAVHARTMAMNPGFAAAFVQASCDIPLDGATDTEGAGMCQIRAPGDEHVPPMGSTSILLPSRAQRQRAAIRRSAGVIGRPRERELDARAANVGRSIPSQPSADEIGSKAKEQLPLALRGAEHSVAPEMPLAPDKVQVTTDRGGLLFLLNAALALGLWGDFTSPRETGLALSPWDWLARIGRLWFGRGFESDPLWPLLADLAGRLAGRDPGRGFAPQPSWRFDSRWQPGRLPSGPFTARRWWRQTSRLLKARIASALGCERAQGPALLCCRQARLCVTSSEVQIHLMLAELPLAIRIAGLDRDPGWIPAAGRSITFHFS